MQLEISTLLGEYLCTRNPDRVNAIAGRLIRFVEIDGRRARRYEWLEENAQDWRADIKAKRIWTGERTFFEMRAFTGDGGRYLTWLQRRAARAEKQAARDAATRRILDALPLSGSDIGDWWF